MKIALTGTGGAGKSTLAALLAKELKEECVPGVMRTVMKEEGIVEADQYKMSDQQKYELQVKGFTARLLQEDQVKDGIFDRTLLDHYAYILTRCAPMVTQEVVEGFHGLIDNTLVTYDMVVYCPLYNWNFQHDGLRDVKYGPRLAVDLIIRGYLDRLFGKIPLIVLGDCSPEQRLKDVLGGLK